MTQIELLREALWLAEEYPDAKIHVCVDSDELSDYGAWTSHKLNKVELGYWYCDSTGMILTDPEEVAEELEVLTGEDVTEDQAIAEMERAILIYTRAG